MQIESMYLHLKRQRFATIVYVLALIFLLLSLVQWALLRLM